MQRPIQDSHGSAGSSHGDDDVPESHVGDFVGESFAGYVVQSRLGEGLGSRVFLAQDASGKRVAAHVFVSSLAANRGEIDLYFEETQVATAARHAGLLETVDVGFASDGSPFQLVELFEGKSLQEALASGVPFSVARALSIAEQLAAALSAAHVWGLVHGALSPKTVLLGPDDRVKIAGFGMSKLTAVRDARAPRFVGIADYMAPEQIDDPSSADARSDLYSLGAVLYSMLVGASPFAKVDPHQLLRFISKEDPRKLRDVRPELRVSLGKVVNRAMRRVRDERYMEMQELIDALAPLERDPREPERAPPSSSAMPVPQVTDNIALAATMLAAPPVMTAVPAATSTVPAATSTVPAAATTTAAVVVPSPEPASLATAISSVDHRAPPSRDVAASEPARVAPAIATSAAPAQKRRGAPIWLVPVGLVVLVGLGVAITRGSGKKDGEPAAKSETTLAGAALAPATQHDLEPSPPTTKVATAVAVKDPAPPSPVAPAPVAPAPVAPTPNPRTLALPPSNPRSANPVAPTTPPLPRRGAPAPATNPAPVAANPAPAAPASPSAPKKRTSADLEPY